MVRNILEYRIIKYYIILLTKYNGHYVISMILCIIKTKTVIVHWKRNIKQNVETTFFKL